MNRFSLTRATATLLLAVAATLGMAQAADTGLATEDSTLSEAGTIPAARPGLPDLSDRRGALGPIRSEPRPTTDPSIRPFLGGPDIRDGLWETVAGNQVVDPNPGMVSESGTPRQNP